MTLFAGAAFVGTVAYAYNSVMFGQNTIELAERDTAIKVQH